MEVVLSQKITVRLKLWELNVLINDCLRQVRPIYPIYLVVP